MGRSDIGNDRETQSRSRHRPRTIRPIEPVEDPTHLVLWDARSSIENLDGVLTNDHGDRPAGGTELDRIAQQVSDRPIESGGIAVHARHGRAFDNDFSTGSADGSVSRSPTQRHQVNLVEGLWRLDCRARGNADQLGHQLGELAHLFAHTFHDRVTLMRFERIAPAAHDIDVCSKARKRRSQLVIRITNEPLLLLS